MFAGVSYLLIRSHHINHSKDQFGRKPVIVVSQSGIIIFVLAFGLSRSFAWALITRALAGALAGNGMLINNVIADITDDTNQAQAYAATGLSLNVAQVIGPFIGYKPCLSTFFALLFLLTRSLVVRSPIRKSRSRKALDESSSSATSLIFFPAPSRD